MNTLTKIFSATIIVVGIIMIIPITNEIARNFERNACVVQLPQNYTESQMEQCIDNNLKLLWDKIK
jgi:hypothetical protein